MCIHCKMGRGKSRAAHAPDNSDTAARDSSDISTDIRYWDTLPNKLPAHMQWLLEWLPDQDPRGTSRSSNRAPSSTDPSAAATPTITSIASSRGRSSPAHSKSHSKFRKAHGTSRPKPAVVRDGGDRGKIDKYGFNLPVINSVQGELARTIASTVSDGGTRRQLLKDYKNHGVGLLRHMIRLRDKVSAVPRVDRYVRCERGSVTRYQGLPPAVCGRQRGGENRSQRNGLSHEQRRPSM
jgi:hypothetical protein